MIFNSDKVKHMVALKSQKLDIKFEEAMNLYIFERVLERISISEYKDNFIIKGGVLVGSLIGNANRTTMDIDATIKNLKVEEEKFCEVIESILAIDLNDGFEFKIFKVDTIRDLSQYNDLRFTINVKLEKMKFTIKLDLTVGDLITPAEIIYQYKSLWGNEIYYLKSYNIETLLSEKIHSVFYWGEFNTRSRDYYDIYMILKLFGSEVSCITVNNALINTFSNRNNVYDCDEVLKNIEAYYKSKNLTENWSRYQLNYHYASDIRFEEVLDMISKYIRIWSDIS